MDIRKLSKRKIEKICDFYSKVYSKETEIQKRKVLEKVLVYPGQNAYEAAFRALDRNEIAILQATEQAALQQTEKKFKIEETDLVNLLNENLSN